MSPALNTSIDPSSRGAAARRPSRVRRSGPLNVSSALTWTVSRVPSEMGARQPGVGEQRRLAAAPQLEQPREAAGEQGREGLRRDLAAEARDASRSGSSRRCGEVDAEADHDAVAAALEQDSGELLAERA